MANIDPGVVSSGLVVQSGSTLNIKGTGIDITVLAGGSAKIYDGAVVSGLNLESGAQGLKIDGGAVATIDGATIRKITAYSNSTTISSGVTAKNITVCDGGSIYVEKGAIVSNLNIESSGRAWSLYDTVLGGTIVGSANLRAKSGSAGALKDFVYKAGAVAHLDGASVLVVSSGAATEGFALGLLSAYMVGEEKCLKLANEGDVFLNGNKVDMKGGMSLDLEGGKLYAGKHFDSEDTGEFNVGGDLTLTQVDLGGAQVYGGGLIDGASYVTKITGDTSLDMTNCVNGNNRVYAGYNVQGDGIALSVNGKSSLKITRGAHTYVRGGNLQAGANTMTVTGDATTEISGGTFDSIVGDYQVGAGATFTRHGDVNVNISSYVVINGALAGAGISFGGEYAVEGNVAIDIKGIEVHGNIYGGAVVGTVGSGAVGISEECSITGSTSITIDCTENVAKIGQEGDACTSIFLGSFAKGTVGGDATLTFKGKASYLYLRGNAVELIGDSGAVSNKKSYVTGESKLVFDGFTCDGDVFLNVQNIAAFDTIEFKNGSKVVIPGLVGGTIDKVSTWGFDAAEGLTVFTVNKDNADGTLNANDFTGDTINVNFDAESLNNSCTLIDAGNAGWFNGFDKAIVKFNGEGALWNSEINGYSDGDFKLFVDTENNDLVLSKIA